MLITVVMPFKDAAPFLREAADSVLAQTWPRVELLLVDDGGTDGSLALAQQICAAHRNHVRVVSHAGRANRGTGPSRALGIREARGELVAWLDADDVWEPGHLEHEAGLLLVSEGVSAVFGRAWLWHTWSNPDRPDTLSALAFAPGVVVPGRRLLAAVLRNGTYATPQCSLLVRKDVVARCADELEGFPAMYEDQVLNSSVQLKSDVVMSGATTAWYRQHDRSISAAHLLPDMAARYDVGRREFLAWVSGQRPHLDTELEDLLAAELEELAQRANQRAGDAPAPKQRTPRRPERVIRSLGRPLRRRAARAAEILEQRRDQHMLRPSRAARAERSASGARLQRLLFRHGSDIRGRVLLLGAPAETVAGYGTTVVVTDALPDRSRPPGPHDDLARLPTSGYDLVLVVDPSRHGWRRRDAAHLRRSLSPGGVLLLVLRDVDAGTDRVVKEVFGADLVRTDSQFQPGPPTRPLRAVRAVVPATGR